MKSFHIALSLIHSILFTWVSACLVFYFVEPAQSADKTLDQSNFRILGLFIGDCASQDIYSKLGPGIAFKDAAEGDETQVCYVSDKDETLILFSFENFQCSRVRLLSQKKKFYKWHFCEKSPLVSKHLATESGIKLGMSKSGLKAILGAPQGESDGNLIYAFEWKRKRNTTETQRDSLDSSGAKQSPHMTLKTTIRAEFSDAKLILFDVSKRMQ
jgi:hypothetical protein